MSKLHKTLTTALRTRHDEDFRSLRLSFWELRERIEIVHTVRLETVTENILKKFFLDQALNAI